MSCSNETRNIILIYIKVFNRNIKLFAGLPDKEKLIEEKLTKCYVVWSRDMNDKKRRNLESIEMWAMEKNGYIYMVRYSKQ